VDGVIVELVRVLLIDEDVEEQVPEELACGIVGQLAV
jgi:hypothetical protein